MKFSFSFGFSPKATCLILIFFAITFKTFSQENNSRYNLLWQISGKGLSKPSYLFGSMHVKDRRAFNFSDSVIKAIQASSGFVLEVHPDSLTKSIFNHLPQAKDKGKITRLITAEQTAELMKRFKHKNGYTPDSALLDNPILVASLMQPDFSKKDDMQTFVDAYLYGIARTLKKKIYGLEKPEDQVKLLYGNDEKVGALFDVDEEMEAKNFEKLINIYANGNLEEISGMLNDGRDDQLDLVGRNKIMLNGITQLITSDNIFIAVGAAHLSGEQGLISLLKKEGYTLRVVKGDFTGVAKSFKIDYAKMDWVKYKDVADNYEIEFPSQPFVTKQIVGKYLTCTDLITDVVYTFNSTYVGPLDKVSPKQYLDSVLKGYTEDDVKLLSKKSDNRFGVVGLDVEMQTNNKFSRSIMLYKNNTLYIINVENAKNSLHEAFVERFISSFKIGDAISTKSSNWLDYKHALGGFSLRTPLQPEEMIKEVANPSFAASPYVMNIYTMLDKVNNVSYLFKYNDFPEGMYVADKETVFSGTVKQLGKNGKIIEGPKTIYKEGLEGREIELLLQGTYMKVQVFLRGNRTYLLMMQNGINADKLKDNDFFSSFKLEKYQDGSINPYQVEDLQVFTPGKPVEASAAAEKDHTSILSDIKTYYSLNRNSGGLYSFETGNLTKYAKILNVDSFYLQIMNGIKKESDTIRKTEDIMVGKSKAKIFTYTDSAAGLERKVKIWIHENRFYYMGVMCTKEELDSKLAHAFFNQSALIGNQKPFDVKASKAKMLFDNLKSKDSLVFNPAFGALSYYEFDKTEIPLISAALRIKYPDDTTANGVRIKLIRSLSVLQKQKSIPLLKELFADLKNSDILRAKALVEVVKLDSTQYGWYLKNLSDTKTLDLQNYWTVFKPLNDSLAFVSKNFDQVLALKNKIRYRTNVLDIVSDLLNEKNRSKYLAQVKSSRDKITATSLADLNTFLKDSENGDASSIYTYLNILPALDLPNLTDMFTKKIIADSIPYMLTQALCARIKANLPLDQKLLDAQLDSLSTRYDILLAFNAKQKLDQVPLKYRKHEELAKVMLYNYLGDEQDYPETITLLDKIDENGKKYYAFEYTFTVEEEKKTYIAVCGAFDDKTDKINFDEYSCYSDFELKSDDWLTQAKALVKVLEEE
ncbi:TraB/GumN family protein [Pedobacter psychrodurus]|uniref:TraB/GumN family protein n=1 Tax=Pedobacter psychrodurus TaxID=2530456 RepID=UPI00292CA923|nr:TraB/GumN family protein [Pedobacter psychrodurus]